MSEHTKEPWDDTRMPNNVYSNDVTGSIIARCAGAGFEFAKRPEQESAANARRIVACVNACAGLETKHLEGVSLKEALDDAYDNAQRITALEAQLAEAERQNAELMKMRHKVINHCIANYSFMPTDVDTFAREIQSMMQVPSDLVAFDALNSKLNKAMGFSHE